MFPELDFDKQKNYIPIRNANQGNRSFTNPLWELAEGGSVAKISGKEGERFEGPAKVFDGEFELIAGISNGRVKAEMSW
jgi:dihydroxy-acid dehydratase